jgi:hypothetical protein
MLRITALTVIVALVAGRAEPARLALRSSVSTSPDLSGTYVLDRTRSDDPSRALDDALKSMPRFKRNAVRKRLGEGVQPADTLRIAVHGDSIALTTSGRLRLTTIPGAPPKARSDEKGRSIQLESAWSGDALIVKTSTDKFEREARYSLDGAAVRVAITMSAGGSAGPFHYALVYRRIAAASAGS